MLSNVKIDIHVLGEHGIVKSSRACRVQSLRDTHAWTYMPPDRSATLLATSGVVGHLSSKEVGMFS